MMLLDSAMAEIAPGTDICALIQTSNGRKILIAYYVGPNLNAMGDYFPETTEKYVFRNVFPEHKFGEAQRIYGSRIAYGAKPFKTLESPLTEVDMVTIKLGDYTLRNDFLIYACPINSMDSLSKVFQRIIEDRETVEKYSLFEIFLNSSDLLEKK